MKDKFEKFACEFKNPAVCEEELDEEGEDFAEIEREHFGEIDEE